METVNYAIKKHAQVWTKDGQLIGEAMHIYYRLENVNPALKYYAAYLEIFSFELGDRYYIPLDFVEDAAAGNGRVNLVVTRKTVEDQTWSRMPAFVATGKARKEDLPD